jgi:hypothetical protein
MDAQSVVSTLDSQKAIDRELVFVAPAYQDESDNEDDALEAIAEEASTKSSFAPSFDATGFT